MSISGNMPSGVSLDELEMDPIQCFARVTVADQVSALLVASGPVTRQRRVVYTLG
jgi:hypothetical protein